MQHPLDSEMPDEEGFDTLLDSAQENSEATTFSFNTGPLNASKAELREELAQQTLDDDDTVTDYDITGEIGQGAMGAILQARHRNLKRKVAYKKILPEFIDNSESLSRFLREMQITAQLEHPNIVPVYEFEFTADGSMAYTMKLIRGKTLKDLIIARRQALQAGNKLPEELSESRLLEYFLSVCDAMHYAHSKGIIHRDLKPANLMIGEYSQVYVMDWGIARQIGRFQTEDDQEVCTGLNNVDENLALDETRAGQILGTPRYMSPQQAAGKNKELDGRSDQFALGLILFELLTCRPAFKAKNTVDLIKKILKVQIEAFEVPKGNYKLPRELKAITLKALAQKPENRYANLAEMAKDIRRYQRGEAVLAEPDPWFHALQRWVSHNRLKALALTMTVVMTATLAVGSTAYLQQAALAKARAMEFKLNHLMGSVSQQAQMIDAHFLKMEALLRYLAASAEQTLKQAPQSNEPHFPNHPFTAPNLIESPLYGANISLDYATAGFSPNKTLKDMQGKLQQLLPLRKTLKEVLLRSYRTDIQGLSEADIQELIAVKGLPLMWSHVSLEEGVIYMFPGIGYNTPGYDARTRPFYTLSAHKYGVFWGNPYFDPLSGALLPATTALYDSNGKFVGVAGIDMRFQYVIDELLTLDKEPRVKQAYLLNAKGEIMIRSAPKKALKSKDMTKAFETPVFDNEALIQEIMNKQRGGYLIDQSKPQAPRLLVFSRLNTLGWYYLVELPYLPEAL